ncbi:MAG: MFS transporter [Gaiellaceae bacterium]
MLRNPSVVVLLIARLVSLTGSTMTLVALPWFVLVTTGSPARMGIVLAAQLLAVALLGIPSGVVLTALGPRRTMLLTDFARVPLMLAVPVLQWNGLLSFPLLVVLAFGIGAFRAPYGAAMNVLMPELAGEEETLVSKANALFQLVTQGTAIFGPIFAGILIGAVGAPTVLVVDAATFLVSGLLVLCFVHAGARAAEVPESRGALAGLRFLRGDWLLGPLVVAAIVLGLAHDGLFGMLPVLAFRRYGDATSAGAIYAADGAGSVLGSLAVMWLVSRWPGTRLLLGAMFVMSVALWPLPVPMPVAGVAGAMFVFGFASMLFVPPFISILTLRTPAPLRPKVMTAYMTMHTLAGPVGLVLAGPSVQAFGLTPVFVAIAAAFTVGAAVLAIVLVRRGGEAAVVAEFESVPTAA